MGSSSVYPTLSHPHRFGLCSIRFAFGDKVQSRSVVEDRIHLTRTPIFRPRGPHPHSTRTPRDSLTTDYMTKDIHLGESLLPTFVFGLELR